jgi:sugar lactone lactonase YvrE
MCSSPDSHAQRKARSYRILRIHSRREQFAIVAMALILTLATARASIAATGDTSATGILGETDFYHNGPNHTSASGLNGPAAVATDAQGHLYVADNNNSRVLGWKNAPSFANGAPADLVIGQPDFGQSNLVLSGCYDGTDADDSFGLGADSLCQPAGLAVDSAGNLYVADTVDDRVLEYDQPFMACSSFPCAGVAANRVFGQSGDFTSVSNGCTPTSQPGRDNLCAPTGIAIDGQGNLYVADSTNNRVLEYNTPLNPNSGEAGAGDTTADLVFGQDGSFTASACYNGTPAEVGVVSADNLCNPTGLALDAAGNLYVVDTGDNRVLVYNTPLNSRSGEPGAGDTTADLVFGQDGFFTHGSCDDGSAAADVSFIDAFSVGPDSLCLNDNLDEGFQLLGEIGGVAVDSAGHVYVADFFNNRVLEYDLSSGAGSGYGAAQMVFGQDGSFTTGIGIAQLPGGCDDSASGDDVYGLGPDSLCYPTSVAVDPAGNLYVADYGNNRVLEYPSPPASNTTTAAGVLGESDFTHNGLNNLDGTGLDLPDALAADTQNRLYIVDTDNNRVLGWRDAPSFANGAAADLVLGEPDFGSTGTPGNCSNGSIGPETLCGPDGAAVDSAGNLFVGDSGDNRVLEYDTPFAACASFPCVGAPANRVFGQDGNFTTTGCNKGKGRGDLRGVGRDSLCDPQGVAVDTAGNLYVADVGNNRVLEYSTPLAAHRGKVGAGGDTLADAVFGQSGSFTTNSCSGGSAPGDLGGEGPDSLCFKAAFGAASGTVAVDAIGNLYVADANDNRVLEYNTPLKAGSGETGAGDTTADLVFGQNGNFTSDGCNVGTAAGDSGGIGPDSLCDPVGIAVDGAGNLYVADRRNSRVLEYNAPLQSDSGAAGAGDTVADFVFGSDGSFIRGNSPSVRCSTNPAGNQGNASGDVNGLGPDSLCGPGGVATDGTGNLYVADSGNNRVLEYDTPIVALTPTSAPTPIPSAVPGELSLSTHDLNFGAVGVGTTATESITIRNSSSVSSLTGTVAGTSSAQLITTAGTGPFVLTPGQALTVAVEFAPTALATSTSALQITSNDPRHSSEQVSIKGKGVPGTLAVSRKVTFAATTRGQSSAITYLNMTNRGPGILHGTVDAPAAPFSIDGGGAFRLAQNESLRAALTFAPVAAGRSFTGTLTITSDDPAHKQVLVTLSGKAK